MQNKKGVSLMISYALLIVITIALGALVYAYLKFYLPSDKTECPEDMSLRALNIVCISDGQHATLSMDLYNAGLFNVSGVYLRFGASERTVRLQIPENKGQELFDYPLAPGSAYTKTYVLNSLLEPSVSNYILEIQPAIFAEKSTIPCTNAIITQPVTCQI
jgi:hypothetical protein